MFHICIYQELSNELSSMQQRNSELMLEIRDVVLKNTEIESEVAMY